MRALGLTTCLCALLACAATGVQAQSASEGEAVVPPGQEDFIADMLGRGAAFPGQCAFTGGQVDGASIRSAYRCAGGEVVLELRHPSTVPAAAMRTARFAVAVVSGTPPPDLMHALESRIRAREEAFEWSVLAPPPTAVLPAPAPRPPLAPEDRSEPRGSAIAAALAGLLAVTALCLVLARLRHLGLRALRRLKPTWQNRWTWAVIAFLVASAVARAWLGVVNWHSNDDHSKVAQMILEAGWQPPPSSACFECSHAKLYHYTLAAALSLTRRIVDLQALGQRPSLVAGNLLNVVAFTVLLAVLFVFSRTVRCSTPVRVLALAFVSFNAGLVGIFSQTTNDGFCILFSALAVFFLGRFFADLSMRRMIAATLFMILAALSKASGWAIFAASVAVLIVKLISAGPRERGRYAAASAVFVLGFLAVVLMVNPYRENIAAAGTPFVSDAFDVPLMKVEVPREPTWVLQDFFTFRYLELLRVPYNQYESEGPYPLHRESLWSQLYGRMFFLRFDQNIWQSTDPRLLALGRLCLVLGLLPFAALLAGTADRVRSVWRGVSRPGLRWFAEDGDWHHLVYAGVMVASLIALIVEYHRLAILFTWMKAFYLFPAILSFFRLFLAGLELLWRRYPRAVSAWMVVMVVVSIADLGWLIHDLRGGPAP